MYPIVSLDLSIRNVETGYLDCIRELVNIAFDPYYAVTGDFAEWADDADSHYPMYAEELDPALHDMQTMHDDLARGESLLYDATGLHADTVDGQYWTVADESYWA